MSERGGRENNAPPVWSVCVRESDTGRGEKREEKERCYRERRSLLFTHSAFWSTARQGETEEKMEKDND